jgi:putative ABC transport system permease protein
MSLYALFYIYRRRLRVHATQELLAGAGVAIAVALIFAVTVANSSVVGSAGQADRAIIGPATLQLQTSGLTGFAESTLAEVERIPGIKQAAPVLQQTATVIGPGGRRATLNVAGAEVSLTILDGLAHTLPGSVLTRRAIGLSEAAASALGVNADAVRRGQAPEVRVLIDGQSVPLKVSAVLGQEAAGAISEAVVGVMPLKTLQELTALRGRISRIFVQPRPGHAASVRAGLERVAAGRLTVGPADQDLLSLREALRPSDLAARIFAAIAGLLGFLFAFNAILLTVPERREAIADLRLSGTRRPAITQMVLFQGFCLGLAASVAGVLLGYALSLGALHQSAGYLSEAFALGVRTVIGPIPVIVAVIGGILATCLASAALLLDLRPRRALDGVYLEQGASGSALSSGSLWKFALGAVTLVVAAIAIFLLAPSLALGATALLALATVLTVPLVFAGTLSLASWLTRRLGQLTTLPVALTALRSTTLRSLALAATGALALFGAITLGGSRGDLLSGLQSFAQTYNGAADIWVFNGGDPLAVNSFSTPGAVARIARLPTVRRVDVYQGQLSDVGNRRVWLVARPSSAMLQLLRTQIVSGNATLAAARLAQGGWITTSQQLANEQHLAIGDSLSLPTPSGQTSFRLAATTTGFGWSPGAILMSTADYARNWASSAPTALGITLAPGANPARVQGEIKRAVGGYGGLVVMSGRQRADRFLAIAREGLGQLAEISTLLVVAAILAMAAALGSAIWQRRPVLAGLRLSGTKPNRLRRILLMESALMLGAGCLTGVLAGVLGQVVTDGYLKHVTGFPVASAGASWRPLEIFALVVALVLAITAIPVWLAARVSPALALEQE